MTACIRGGTCGTSLCEGTKGTCALIELAYQAHIANANWNSHSNEWNQKAGTTRWRAGQAQRGWRDHPGDRTSSQLIGHVRTIGNSKSSLYNTDGQIFSDIGAPVVLFMENYDIDRSGYHDTKDTMENIDLDYGAALSAIAIETTARVAALANDHIPRASRFAYRAHVRRSRFESGFCLAAQLEYVEPQASSKSDA